MSEPNNTNNHGKWIRDTATLFYQIFSVDYQDEGFITKLLSGGGGNSTLCSTWTHLNGCFVPYRISENAYNLLREKLGEKADEWVCLKNNTVYVSKQVYKKHPRMFYHNAKGAENRVNVGKFFHFDHNPSNKKVLALLNEKIKAHKNDEEFLEELTEYVRTVQTIDLITVFEDDIRTSADKKSRNGPLTSEKRDELLNTRFYCLKDME